MRRKLWWPCLGSGWLAVASALAPAQQEAPPPPPVPSQPPQPQQPPPAMDHLEALAKARAASAAKTYDLSWVYYSENRISAGDVYAYSRLRLAAEQDIAADKAGRVEAARGHRDRMEKLWRKVAKIRKLGFSNTLDLNEAEYYYTEGEYWLAREQAWDDR